VRRALEKCPTGIQGFDEVTEGGLPRGRPTLICGGPGCGKTIFALEFLLRGARDHDEAGVFVSFEETAADLTKNVASLGFDLDQMVRQKKMVVDHVRVERSEIEETGEYDLDGLFIRLGYAIDSIGARRVVLDTIESLFSGFSDVAILRAELRRLFGWLKEKGVTAVITGERGEGALTRQGLEEYVSDCVVLLDHRTTEGVSTRRLRVVKYRGSTHGTNEYPFLIDNSGVTILPITSLGLTHAALNERVSSGIPRLDGMLHGGGFYRGSSILVTGTAGTGKSSLAAHFASASCNRGERCLYFAFEESQSQILRNMRSIGIDLAKHVNRGLLRFHNTRPSAYGLEMHLAVMFKAITEFEPSAVIVDPVSNLDHGAAVDHANRTLVRLVDILKMRGITSFFTSLTRSARELEATDLGISSLMDTWLLLKILEMGGERNRGLYVLKSRGMSHSNQVREFVLTDHGIQLVDVYTGGGGVLTGSARIAQQAGEAALEAERQVQAASRRQAFLRKHKAVTAQIGALQADLDAESAEIEAAEQRESTRDKSARRLADRLAQSRDANRASSTKRLPRSEARS
jgi:circadian clock protein KaiC